jgi:F-type H+-transporting ATPase subunit gamma
MAERLADLVTQIRNVGQLEAVITAMRGIAASRAQKGRLLLAGVEAYANVVSRAIGETLSLLPAQPVGSPHPRAAKLGLILFCAEQGFAGAFSHHVLDAASADYGKAMILLVGTRGKVVASERGIEPAASVPMVTHVDTIPSLADRLADTLYRYVAADDVERVEIIFPRARFGGGIVVDRRSLLPLDFGRFTSRPSGMLPLTNLQPRLLLEHLTAEYVFAELCEAATHAFTAENEARMLAMASAKQNIGTRLATLSHEERQLRQEEITTEILELAAGSEAVTRKHG